MNDESEFDDAVLVVAHPDDEVLWFSSVIGRVGKVIICYGDVVSSDSLSDGRRAVVNEYPLKTAVFLNLREAEVFGTANWRAPRITPYGIAVERKPNSMAGFSVQCYEENFSRLQELLAVEIKGARRVFTHNPWGEYGHEEHVQVFRVVDSLRARLSFSLHFSSYCSVRSMPLLMQSNGVIGGRAWSVPTDIETANRISAIYKRHDCWTWFHDYVWPSHDTFLEIRPEGSTQVASDSLGGCIPLAYIKLPAEPKDVVKLSGGLRAKLKALARRVLRGG